MRRSVPILVMALGLTVILFGVIAARYSRLLASPGDAPLPMSIAGLLLEDFAFGEEAVVEITRLHRAEFPLTSGAMGSYGGHAEIRLWSTGTVNRLVAAKMVSAMRNAIGAGNAPFISVSEANYNGRTIYRVDGMGQQHYYFHVGDFVIWFAAESSLADQALDEVLEFYHE
ncbi:MAG: hypothetical protein GTO14_08955 [Anaerolineales bacterium]|nr:hypothetical protein [Anaerolineales bacterium]